MLLRIAVADHLLDHWAGRTDEPLSTEELDVLAAGLVAEHHAARVEIREAKEALAEVRREIKAEPPKDARDAENTADYLDIVRESVKLAKEWVQETSLLAAAAAKRESLAERLEAEGGTGSGLPARIRAFRKWAAAEVKRLAHSHEWTLDREKKEIAADHTDFGSLESLLRFDAHFRRALHRDLAAIERLRAPGSAFSAP